MMDSNSYGHGDGLKLPDDIIALIFLRLPMSSLYVARQACKSWRRIISDPSFARCYRGQQPPLLGLFLYGTCGFFPASSSSSSSSSSPDHAFMLSNIDNFRMWHLLCSDNGNLLFWRDRSQDYCIFNPSTKQIIAIPHVPGFGYMTDVGFICNADSTCYKLVRLEKDEQRMEDILNVDTYSSETKQWICRRIPPAGTDYYCQLQPWTCMSHIGYYCPHHPRITKCLCYCPPVAIGNMIYCLCEDFHVLAYDSSSMQHLFVKPPMLEHEPSCSGDCLLVSNAYLMATEGRLRYTLQHQRKFYVWVLRDGFTWLLEHCISIGKILEGNRPLLQRFLRDYTGHYTSKLEFRPFGFDSVDRNWLFFSVAIEEPYLTKFLSFHLQTTELKELSPSLSYKLSIEMVACQKTYF